MIVNHGLLKVSNKLEQFPYLDYKVGANWKVFAVDPPNDRFKSVENQDDGL